MIQQLITFLSPAFIYFRREAKPKNLKDFLEMKLQFPYEPVPFVFDNAGSRDQVKPKVTNQFKPNKNATKRN